MKKAFLLFGVLVSSFGVAQSRLTVADYVLAMPNDLRLVENPELKTWIGNPKISEKLQRGCATVNKNLQNDYLSLVFGGCEPGSGDLNVYALAVWRSVSSKTVFIGAQYGYSTDFFASSLVFSSTTDGQKFRDVTNKILPMTALKNTFSKCKISFNEARYKIPQRGTSILVKGSENLEYSLDWNNKTNIFVLGKGKC